MEQGHEAFQNREGFPKALCGRGRLSTGNHIFGRASPTWALLLHFYCSQHSHEDIVVPLRWSTFSSIIELPIVDISLEYCRGFPSDHYPNNVWLSKRAKIGQKSRLSHRDELYATLPGPKWPRRKRTFVTSSLFMCVLKST